MKRNAFGKDIKMDSPGDTNKDVTNREAPASCSYTWNSE
jgi:hypothetical protein